MNKEKYRMYINLEQDGRKIVLNFANLSKKEAETLHKLMEENYAYHASSAEVLLFGWSSIK